MKLEQPAEPAENNIKPETEAQNKEKIDPRPTRKFIESVIKTDPPAEFYQAVENMDGKGKYTPRNTKKLWAEAVEKAQIDPLGTLQNLSEARTDKAIANGLALAKLYEASGDKDTMSAIYVQLAERATEAGRAVQAFSLLQKSTPEGMMLNIERKIDKYNNIQEKRGKYGKSLVELNDNKKAEIMARLEEVYSMPAGTKEEIRAKKIAMGQLSKDIGKLAPSKKWDKFMTIWKAGLLSAPPAHVRNILGNTVNAIGEGASSVVGSGIDWLASKATGRRTNIAILRGGWKGFKEGGRIAGDILTKGVDTSGDASVKFDNKSVHFGDGRIGKITQRYTDTVFNLLNAADKPFKQMAYIYNSRNSSTSLNPYWAKDVGF